MLLTGQSYTEDGRQLVLWEELGEGAPTLIAFARLCSDAIARERQATVDQLSVEARAILYTARRRGAVEIKAVNHAFDSSERFLTVCIELDDDEQLFLKRKNDPELTIRFLDGFRELCSAGMIMHHLYRDFSLTRAGFEIAKSLTEDAADILKPLAKEQTIDTL